MPRSMRSGATTGPRHPHAGWLLRSAALLILLLCALHQAGMSNHRDASDMASRDVLSQFAAGATVGSVPACGAVAERMDDSEAPVYPQLASCPLLAALGTATAQHTGPSRGAAVAWNGDHLWTPPDAAPVASRPGPAPPNSTARALLQVFLN
jgi:hypothetical protein